MTAQQFADLAHARPAGPMKWIAKCPAHQDSSPSLSIREARDGRVLVNCFAGCTLTSVISAFGLKIRDLFNGPPPSTEALAAASALRDRQTVQRLRARQKERVLEDSLRRLESLADSIGAKLARIPDDSLEGVPMTKLFHEVCDRRATAAANLDDLYQENEPAGTGSRRIPND